MNQQVKCSSRGEVKLSVVILIVIMVALTVAAVTRIFLFREPPSAEVVTMAQEKLEAIGEPSTYDRTTIHGVLNQITIDNIKYFQAAIDKPVTGTIDSELLQQLENSRHLVESAALRGVAKAQVRLGYWYQTAKNGYPFDAHKAVEWNMKAVAQGDPEAQLRQGYFHQSGYGVKQSHEAAMEWFQKAVAQDYPLAQFHVGLLHKLGLNGVEKNEGKAAIWYRKSAEQGEIAAQLSLGVLYEQGIGLSKNYGEALKWYRRAAEQGSSQAMQRLGAIYEIGKGVSPDAEEAAKWYSMASKQGETQTGDAYNKNSWQEHSM